MKCWWNGAYVPVSTIVAGAVWPGRRCVVTMMPVARISHSMLPSVWKRQ